MSETLRHAALALDLDDFDPAFLTRLIGDARIVMLGESTHGTHEFYRLRAQITRRLVEERGFTTVAIEGDWPDAYRVNRYVRGVGDDGSADEALSGFRRFPTWMWRNTEMIELVDWLHTCNSGHEARDQAGFYGLDLYSLHASRAAVLDFLDQVDPEGADRARARYACFDHFGQDTQGYGYATAFGLAESCEQQAVQQLVELQRRAGELTARDGRLPEDEFFFAEQNARLVPNAEAYYRSMFRGRISSWNLRDRHMADTLDAIIAHFDARGIATKAIVWAHNSHVGDARATEMGKRGEWNIGQLARERHRSKVALIGFTTYTGTVTAARDWTAGWEAGDSPATYPFSV
jgi:erythromycin esterase-like protein